MSDNYFVQDGSVFFIRKKDDCKITDTLPPGNYIVKTTPFKEYYLERTDNFIPLPKLYGNCLSRANRILNTFNSRGINTGVLLAGDKGTGKSLLAKQLSILGAELGYPTIMINEPHSGEGFNTLMMSLSQPTIVLFDEFEKVYQKNDVQTQLLTILDGVYASKKLFILTCNDPWKLDENMHNRPGRLYYSIPFTGLETEFIEEYCEDVLENKSYIHSITKIAATFKSFSFDMLSALVEEMNRYNESPQDALAMLNATPARDQDSAYTVTATISGVKYTSPNKMYINPLDFSESVYMVAVGMPPVVCSDADEDEVEEASSESTCIHLSSEQIINFDYMTKTFTLKKDNGTIAYLKSTAPKVFNFAAY